MGFEQGVGGEDGGGVAFAAQDEDAEIGFVGAEVQDGVVELAGDQKGPEIWSAAAWMPARSVGRWLMWRLDEDGGATGWDDPVQRWTCE